MRVLTTAPARSMRRSIADLVGHAKTAIVTATITVIVMTMAGAALAASGTINACVNNASGELRIVGAGTSCPTNWTAISWNQEGQQGPAGATGPSGATGATGATGANGVSGYQVVTLANAAVGTLWILEPDGTVQIDTSDPNNPTGSCAISSGGGSCYVFVYCPSGLVPFGGGYAFRKMNGDGTFSNASNKVLNISIDRAVTFETDPNFPDLFPAGTAWRLQYNGVGIASSTFYPAFITVSVTCARAN